LSVESLFPICCNTLASAVYRRVAHRKMALSEAAIPCLPMHFPVWRALWGDRAEVVSGSSLGRRRQSSRPPVSRTDAGGFGFSALCMTTGLSRGGDRLDPLTYCVGSGLSWKPSAAAFRFSAFNILAFTLASYSSIDCVTYSWPYLSIR
jgi:hypothetical protein